MKLAEALILRADYQKRMEQLKSRISRNAKVQDGEKVAEDPKELLQELNDGLDELTKLVQKINKTNTQVLLDNNQTLSDALTMRETLHAKHLIYRQLAEDATVTQDRYSRTEIKFKSTVDIAKIQEKADDLALAYREIDTKIQEKNWLVDLAEE